MSGFSDALDVLGGDSTPPREPLRVTVRPPSKNPSGFGGALNILSGDEPAKEVPKSDKTISGLQSFGTGLRSGLTANFSDELSGVAAAGRTLLPDIINPDKPESLNSNMSPLGHIISVAAGAGRLGYEAVAGRGEGTEAYEKARDAERERQRLASEQHPVANIAGNVAGAVALPAGGFAGGATMPARMAGGAAIGAGYGAAYGAGEGTDAGDRATRAVTGGTLGAVGGAVAPPILSGIGAVGSAIGSRVVGHPIQTIRAGLNPDAEAAKRIGTNILADVESGKAGLSGADLAAARSSGQPTAIIDIGGENTRALARSAANTSPSARAALEDFATSRFADQAQRTQAFVRDLVPTPGSAFKTQEAIDTAERAANKPAYLNAYQKGDKPIWDDSLAALAEDPTVLAAMRRASISGRNEETRQGLRPFKQPFDFTGATVTLKRDPNGNTISPNLQYWDAVKRELDKGDRSSQLFAKSLRDHLDTIVPEYKTARAGAAEFFQAENALEAGQKFVTMRGSLDEARAAHGKLTPAQKALFAEGYVSDLADKVSKVSDNRSVTIDKIFNSPDGRARTELALGKNRAEDLELFLRRENMMDLARTAIRGNSTTARQLMEAGIAGGVGGAAGGAAEAALKGDFDARSVVTAALLGGAASGHRAINFKVAQRVGEMLASNDPKVLLTAIKMAKTNPDAGRAMRGAERILEKVIGQKSNEAVPMLPSVATGRADQQQQ